MRSLRDMRLKWRITLAVFMASTLVAIVVLSLVFLFGASYAQRTAREIAIKTAQENAAVIGGILRDTLSAAHSLGSAMLGQRASGPPNRAKLDDVIKTFIARRPELLGAWAAWEPNALDGRDAEFANTPGHDATGRFMPYWNLLDGTLHREVNVGYDVEGAGDYYLVPKRTRQSAIIGPYYYPVRGKDVLLVSLVVPLIVNGEFLGVAGYDITTERLQKTVNAIKPYETGYATLLTETGMYAAHPDAKRVLTGISDVGDPAKVKAAIRSGLLHWTVERSDLTGGDAIKVYAPLMLEGVPTPWSLEVIAPMNQVMAPVYALAQGAILLAAIAILASTFVAYGIGRSIARPITDTANGITAIAEGDADAPIGDLNCQDEIGALARATHRLRDAVRDSIRLSNLVKTLPGALYEVYIPDFNSRGTMKYMSESILAKTGYTAAEIIDDLMVLKPFREHTLVRIEKLKQAAAKGGQFEAIWDYIRKDGSRGCFLERGTVTPNPLGGYNLTGLLIDYLAAREAEDQLKTNRAQLQDVVTALDEADEAISIAYPFEEILYANKSFAEMFADGDPTKVIGKRMADYVLSTDPPFSAIKERLVRSIADGESLAHEAVITLKKDHSVRVINWTVSPLADGRMLNVTRDVTELRDQEQREDQLRSQLVEAQKMESIGRLAGGVAHDFNNILGAVRTFANLISDDSADGSTSQKFANRIVSTCDRAADIVRQILLFARASQSELTPLRARDVIEEVRTYLMASVPKHVTLKVEVPAEDVAILGNAGQLVQMLMNLGVNARDAMGEKGGEIQILGAPVTLTDQDLTTFKLGLSQRFSDRGDGTTISQFVIGAALRDQKYLCLTVRDNGPGVSAATLGRMFEPFFTTKEKARGTGLGLSVVASVITAHTGFIVVTTQEGYGCRFNIYLPMTTATVQAKPIALATSDLRGTERVLLVDDEIDLADAVSLALRKFGYIAEPHYNPTEALARFTSEPGTWDVVITDQVMPELKGLELIERIKKIRPDIPVIMCTGYSDNTTERRAVATGAAAFFVKPVQPETLAFAIRQARRHVADAMAGVGAD